MHKNSREAGMQKIRELCSGHHEGDDGHPAELLQDPGHQHGGYLDQAAQEQDEQHGGQQELPDQEDVLHQGC